MPNWVSTQMSLSSNKKGELVKFWNKVLGKAYKSINEMVDEKPKITLSTFIGGIPQTFKDYDTTNYTAEKLQKCYDKGERTYGFERKELTPEVIKAFAEAEKYQREKYGVVGWYDFGCAYLGTKWDTEISEYSTYYSDSECKFYFDTAWSPAEPIFHKIAQIIKEEGLEIYLEVKVREETDEFAGIYDNDGGDLNFAEVEVGKSDDDFFASYEEVDDLEETPEDGDK